MFEKNARIDKFNKDYHLYYDRCVIFARTFVFDEEEAKSIASDAMIVLWDKTVQEGEDIEKPLAYLFSVIRLKALHSIRKKLNRERVISGISSDVCKDLEFRLQTMDSIDPQGLYTEEINSIVSDTMSRLEKKSRKIFEMSRIHGLTNNDIATSLGISVKAVEYHITKTLKTLRNRLSDYI